MKLLLCYHPEHANIIQERVAPLLREHQVAMLDKTLEPNQIVLLSRKGGFDAVLMANEEIIDEYIKGKWGHLGAGKLPAAELFAGSCIKRAGVDWLFLPSPDRLVDSNFGTFLYRRYLSKITNPAAWVQPASFSYSVYGQESCKETAAALVARFATARLLAYDIETTQQDLQILCASYTGLWYSPESGWSHYTLVVPVIDELALALIRQLNLLPVPKVMQNGKYDSAYSIRWGAPIVNWLWDTQTFFHCWYSELPKRLDFLGSFFLRDFEYWKHESSSGQLSDLHRYNAKDSWATGMVLLAMLREAPDWAIRNYQIEFPLNMPCMWSETFGIKCDMPLLTTVEAELISESDAGLAKIQRMLGLPGFNPNSPKQMVALFAVLGAPKITSAAEKQVAKVARLHPINSLLLGKIMPWKKRRKLLSTYLKPEKFLGGRVLYALNPHGTDTGRLASKQHHFWCGLQIQNIPRGNAVKQLFVADDGWLLGEADGEQAEARYVAYLSGDPALIKVVESDKDYHSLNAERFFGVPYDQIITPDGKVLLKDLRDLSKRTNHGANYNMGEAVMLDTMGIEKVLEAKKILRLPPEWSAIRVTRHLLEGYSDAYPMVKSDFYNKIKADIRITKMLVAETGWTRYCFGNPDARKPDLNAYVAHVPQGLNAQVLNMGYMKVFNEIQLAEPDNFRLLAQIHDSILFAYRIGHEHLAHKVKELMQIPIDVKGADGVTRNMCVPVALKFGKRRWSEL